MRHCDNFINMHVMEELSEGHQKPCDTSQIKALQKEDYRKHKECRQKTDRSPDRADGGTVE